VSEVRLPRNLPGSIRQRLLNHARDKGEDFQLLLDRYAVERLLYRLSISDMRGDFLLKGALLFLLWFNAEHRPTRDADFLGMGKPDIAHLTDSVRRLCSMKSDDGIEYDVDSIKVQEIRENASYQGLRVTLRATLDGARCMVQLDVGYGDAVTPAPIDITYPSLLEDLSPPKLRAYPRETVFSEKLEAMVILGMANTRMKDYFDLLALARENAMDSTDLARAIHATFQRRKTELPESTPTGLTIAFATDAQKQKQWRAFLDRNRLDAPSLDIVVKELVEFLQQPLALARDFGTRRSSV
jgi:predicted nucleotidyltransferase component of viral defense system